MSWLKEEAPANMPRMVVTEDTSQAEMLPLKEAASRNIHDMSVTRERSGISVALVDHVGCVAKGRLHGRPRCIAPLVYGH